MSVFAIMCAVEFNNYLSDKKYDGILIRGDRFELLGITMVSSYKEIPIFHIEAGDESGVIDQKVRHAITKLADYHFPTNDEAHARLINMGCKIEKVFNFGALDTEFAQSVIPKKLQEDKYIMITYHPIDGEDENEIDKALESFPDYKIIRIGSNKDYGRQYGEETYSPDDYINLMRYASCLVGNSSSLIKEASILKVPVVLVGDRQTNRLKPRNVFSVPCESGSIKDAIEFQLKRVYPIDHTYFKTETSIKISEKINEILCK